MLDKIQLYSPNGERLYLNTDERERYLDAVRSFEREKRMYCSMLYWTGCRLSEPLNMTTARIDLAEEAVIIETLKQRKENVFRKIPIPEVFKNELSLTFNLATLQKSANPNHHLLWPFSRRTAHRYVKEAMSAAKITGTHASAKGLRHGFAVHCVLNQIPLPTLQKWMGHASMETTAIYLQVSGKEERELASKIW